MLCSANRPRHLRTVFTLTPLTAVIPAFAAPSAASSTILARSTARTCPDLDAAIFANCPRTTSSSMTGTACATAHRHCPGC